METVLQDGWYTKTVVKLHVIVVTVWIQLLNKFLLLFMTLCNCFGALAAAYSTAWFYRYRVILIFLAD